MIPSGDGRLPRNVLPMHYDIEIAPNFYQALPFPFDGTVAIVVRCTVSSSSIVLNSKFLLIKTVSIEVDPNSMVSVLPPSITSVSQNRTTHSRYYNEQQV